MKKVNGYFMKKYADYTIPSFYGRVRPSNIWTRGVYYEGLMALYSIYPREDYYKSMPTIGLIFSQMGNEKRQYHP